MHWGSPQTTWSYHTEDVSGRSHRDSHPSGGLGSHTRPWIYLAPALTVRPGLQSEAQTYAPHLHPTEATTRLPVPLSLPSLGCAFGAWEREGERGPAGSLQALGKQQECQTPEQGTTLRAEGGLGAKGGRGQRALCQMFHCLPSSLLPWSDWLSPVGKNPALVPDSGLSLSSCPYYLCFRAGMLNNILGPLFPPL